MSLDADSSNAQRAVSSTGGDGGGGGRYVLTLIISFVTNDGDVMGFEAKRDVQSGMATIEVIDRSARGCQMFEVKYSMSGKAVEFTPLQFRDADGVRAFLLDVSTPDSAHVRFLFQDSTAPTPLGLWYESAEKKLLNDYLLRTVTRKEPTDKTSETLLNTYFEAHLPSMFGVASSVSFVDHNGDILRGEKDLTIYIQPATFQFAQRLIDPHNVQDQRGPSLLGQHDTVLSSCHVRLEIKTQLTADAMKKGAKQLKDGATPVAFATDVSGLSGAVRFASGPIAGKVFSCVVAFEVGEMCAKLLRGGEGDHFREVDAIAVIGSCYFVPVVFRNDEREWRRWLALPAKGRILADIDRHLMLYSRDAVITTLPPTCTVAVAQ